jgi:hypothetical protein
MDFIQMVKNSFHMPCNETSIFVAFWEQTDKNCNATHSKVFKNGCFGIQKLGSMHFLRHVCFT